MKNVEWFTCYAGTARHLQVGDQVVTKFHSDRPISIHTIVARHGSGADVEFVVDPPLHGVREQESVLADWFKPFDEHYYEDGQMALMAVGLPLKATDFIRRQVAKKLPGVQFCKELAIACGMSDEKWRDVERSLMGVSLFHRRVQNGFGS